SLAKNEARWRLSSTTVFLFPLRPIHALSGRERSRCGMIIPLLLALSIVLTTAKLGGWLLNRLGQPPVLGQLLVGLLLGPSVFNLFAQPYFATAHTVETLHELGEIGVILLMFAAGLEIHLEDLTRTGKPAVFTGVLGVIVPLLASLAIAPLFGYTL